MAQTGSAVRLYGPDSLPLDVLNGVAVPAGTAALIPAVVDPTGSIARFIRGDALGRPDTLMGSWLGSTAPTVGIKTTAASIPVTMASDQPAIPVSITTSTTNSLPSYYAVFDRIAPAANKYMATLFNTSATRKAVVQRMWAFNWQFDNVASAGNMDQYVARITVRTAGAAVTIRSNDTTDILSAGIAADTNSTLVTENHVFKRIFMSNDELDLATQRVQDLLAFIGIGLVWERKEGMRGIVLRQNQGLSFRNLTASTNGSCSYIFEFTDEAV